MRLVQANNGNWIRRPERRAGNQIPIHRRKLGQPNHRVTPDGRTSSASLEGEDHTIPILPAHGSLRDNFCVGGALRRIRHARTR